jgi:hypothetical protein
MDYSPSREASIAYKDDSVVTQTVYENKDFYVANDGILLFTNQEASRAMNHNSNGAFVSTPIGNESMMIPTVPSSPHDSIVGLRSFAEGFGAMVQWAGNYLQNGIASARAYVSYGNRTPLFVSGALVNGLLMINDAILNSYFGWDRITLDDARAGVVIHYENSQFYRDITTPVKNALDRGAGKFEQHIESPLVPKNFFLFLETHDKGEWNLKYREGGVNRWEEKLGISFWGYSTEMIIEGNRVIVEDVGNIVYGYLGTAMGFGRSWLNFGSSAYHSLTHGDTEWENEKADLEKVAIGINWYKASWR